MKRRRRLRLVARLVSAVAVLGGALALPAEARRSVDCADYGSLIDFTLEANLKVSQHGTKCVITGTVDGNVLVTDNSTICDPPPNGVDQQFAELTAVNVIGGTVEGNLESSGGRCAMLWLRDGAVVAGNVRHNSGGNLGFLDVPGDSTPTGSTVLGSATVGAGKLFASSVTTNNRVEGHIVCDGGTTSTGNPGSATDWDGDGGTDGTIGGHYDC